MSVCLNLFVMKCVSFPMYVNVAHFCFEGRVTCRRVMCLACCLCGATENELFCIMLWMVLSSCLCSVSAKFRNQPEDGLKAETCSCFLSFFLSFLLTYFLSFFLTFFLFSFLSKNLIKVVLRRPNSLHLY
jgi:hypothetical protein